MRYIKEFEKIGLIDRILFSKGVNYQHLLRNEIYEFAKEVFKKSDIEPSILDGVYHIIWFRKKFEIDSEIGYINIKDEKDYLIISCEFVDEYVELNNFIKYIKKIIWSTVNGYRIYFKDIKKFLSELTMEKYELYCDIENYNL